jgi:hypothetical protein
MLIAFFSWWYGQGWKQVAGSLGPRLRGTAEAFSVNQLSRTLFSPWKRIISTPGRSLEERLRAWADNMFSRVIGFCVRVMVLLAALLVSLAVSVFTVFEIVAWPLVPFGVVVLIVLGATA